MSAISDLIVLLGLDLTNTNRRWKKTDGEVLQDGVFDIHVSLTLLIEAYRTMITAGNE